MDSRTDPWWPGSAANWLARPARLARIRFQHHAEFAADVEAFLDGAS
ncbi:MAG: hypothetical protein WAL72_08990 [Streptosporangiaceae bacterium]